MRSWFMSANLLNVFKKIQAICNVPNANELDKNKKILEIVNKVINEVEK